MRNEKEGGLKGLGWKTDMKGDKRRREERRWMECRERKGKEEMKNQRKGQRETERERRERVKKTETRNAAICLGNKKFK